MFGQGQAQLSNEPAQAGYAVPQPPTEYGVSSAIKDLLDASHDIVSSSQSLRSVLGISIPDETQKTPEPSSLVAVLATVTSWIRKANADVNDSVRHLNS